MRDRWNVEQADWSSSLIAGELEKVAEAGRRLALKLLRDKLVLMAVAVGAVLFCFFFMNPIVGLVTELVILTVVMNYVKKSSRNTQAPLYRMCDPYLQFAYVRAYGEFLLIWSRRAVCREILSLAQCMAMAGEPQAALAIQGNISDPQALKPAERAVYYNTILNCYGQYGWEEKRAMLVSELKRARDTAGKAEQIQLNVVLRLEELKRRQDNGDIQYVEEYFKKIPPVYPFQAVGMHYALGMMYMKQGDAESAREHVEYVLEKGNKLYYKKNLEAYLLKSLED